MGMMVLTIEKPHGDHKAEIPASNPTDIMTSKPCRCVPVKGNCHAVIPPARPKTQSATIRLWRVGRTNFLLSKAFNQFMVNESRETCFNRGWVVDRQNSNPPPLRMYRRRNYLDTKHSELPGYVRSAPPAGGRIRRIIRTAIPVVDKHSCSNAATIVIKTALVPRVEAPLHT